jgi:hypothetical protein
VATGAWVAAARGVAVAAPPQATAITNNDAIRTKSNDL